MISRSFHYYPPGAESKLEHPLWVHNDVAFLVALSVPGGEAQQPLPGVSI